MVVVIIGVGNTTTTSSHYREVYISIWCVVIKHILKYLCCVGVEWVEMHKLAERVELEELKKCGILHGDVEEMMKVNS